MPSLGIHFLVLDEVTAALSASTNSDDQSYLRILNQYPEFASLGAIGPDLGFFLGSDPRAVGWLSDVYSWTNRVRDVFETTGALTGQAGFTNVTERLRQLGASVDGLLVAAESSLVENIFSLASVFKGPLVKPSEIESNAPERDWNWGDILHWRVTGSLARDLLIEGRSTGNDEWIAYAMGYMTHLATDTIGHAYTNQVVGGPARSWGARHHLAENFMDTHAYFAFKNQDVGSAQFHKRIEGVKSSGKLNAFARMMSELLGVHSLRSQGTPNVLPRQPSADELEDAYEAMLRIVALVTNTVYLAPPKFPGISLPPLPWENSSFTQQAASGIRPSRRWSFWGFMKAIFRSVLVGLGFVADLIRLALDVALGLATYPLAAALYQAQLALYGVYRAIHWLLVLAVIAFPAPDELGTGLGQQFIPCGIPDPKFPRQLADIASWNEVWQIGLRSLTLTLSNYYYLDYPDTSPERPYTLSSPYMNEVPAFFVNQATEDPNYTASWKAVSGPEDLDALHQTLRTTMNATGQTAAALGNARDFSLKLIHGELNLAEFNLDSDRGYSYYRWRSDGSLPTGPVTTVRFF